MVLLDKSKYDKVLGPLKQVIINNLFARSVVEQQLPGSIYVDNINSPATFHVFHPYGMSLLFGKPDNKEFNSKLFDYCLNTNKIRTRYEWMQAFPGPWDSKLEELFRGHLVKSADNLENDHHDKIELNTRVNFKFNINKYLEFKQNFSHKDFQIARTDKEIYEQMKGSVVPMYFFENANHFYTQGVGFSLFYEGQLASTAFSAFILDRQLEIGIETIEKFRNKGFAKYTCSSLIDYCLDHNYEPVWSCKLENIGSYTLAQELGFEPTFKLPFYRLIV
jgi:RimJ/RimL family protein N-acetyltransferase